MIKKLCVLTLLFLLIVAFPKSITQTNAATNVVTLTKDNLMVLNGEVSSDSVGKLILLAREMDQVESKSFMGSKKEPLYLWLYTPGGSIEAGYQLMEAMNGLERKVNTISFFSASMGFQIAQGLSGDRLILKSGVLMSHKAKGGFEGEFGGTSSQLDSRYKIWLDRIKEMDMQTVKRSNGKLTYEKYIKAYEKELWVTGAEAVADGYADRVVTIRCDSSLAGTSKHSVTIFGIEILYELDMCPINSDPINASLGRIPFGVSQEAAELVKKQFLEKYRVDMRSPKDMTL